MHKANLYLKCTMTVGVAGLVLGGIATSASHVTGSTTPPGPLSDFNLALFKAKSISAAYSVQMIGAGSESYTMYLKKPNLARIDTPFELIVADGKSIVTLNKSDNVYYRRPWTVMEAKSIFRTESANVWSGFFDPGAYIPIVTKNLGSRTRKDQTLSGVQATYDSNGDRQISYFIAESDHILRQAQITVNQNSADGLTTSILDVKTLAVNPDFKMELFTFTAPPEAKSVTLAELNAVKWLTDFDEAKLVAAKTGKKIFVDFCSKSDPVWKKLNEKVYQTERFKREVQTRIVPLRIDLNVDPTLGRAYNVPAIPAHGIIDKKGKLLDQQAGFTTVKSFYQFLDDLLNP